MLIIRHYLFTILLIAIIPVTSFAQQQNAVKLFTTLPQTETGVNFTNTISETPEMFLYLYENLYVGTGVSVADINNDGLPDIYFNSTLGSNKRSC